MILLLSGPTHSGKSVLAQHLLELYHIPYYSIDHIKMGLIRSHQTSLTPNDDEQLTTYLWPILKEMIQTAIENHQHFILEGCYIPFTWQEDFTSEDLKQIQYISLIFSKEYIQQHQEDILSHASDLEQRLDPSLDFTRLEEEHAYYLQQCQQYQLPYLYIQQEYLIDYSYFSFLSQ